MRKKRPSAAGKAGESALRLLAVRDHSLREMERKLAVRGFTAGEITDALKGLKAHGYLDDFRYARRQAAFLTREKLFGPQRIGQKLFEKGIPAELAREAISEAEAAFPARERLRAVLQMKLKGLTLQQLSPRERRQLFQFLYRRGFPWEDVSEVFQEAGGFSEE